MSVREVRDVPVGVGSPRWVAASLEVKEGRDPLGLQTTTQDRLMPRLLPGILELSRRARYFSFHAYLLDKYRELRLPADGTSLSTFIKAREWEYGLAVLKCPHRCGSSPVGAQSLRQVVNNRQPPYPRGQSVESPYGGYGLYYRSPLADLGIVARSGTLLGTTPISVDVLYDNDRARRLADTFREAVEATEYATAWMLTTDPIPLDVLVEYARVACLCQLRNCPAERDAVHGALFDYSHPEMVPEDPEITDGAVSDNDGAATLESARPGAGVIQRQRSVAHYLTLIAANPAVVNDAGAYREALWSPSSLRSTEHELVAGQWAGLIAKDVWQDALCSVWSEFCRTGLGAARAKRGEGLTWEETRDISRAMVAGPPILDAATPTIQIAARIISGEVGLPGVERPLVEVALEVLRAATVVLDSATSGLIVLLELHRRSRTRNDPGWIASSSLRSAWQPSVASVLQGLSAHLDEAPTVADTLWWVVHKFIIGVHERIAYSKLPEHTFRFRWEDGHVHFYNNGIGRFPLAAIRREPLALLTRDLGFWENGQDGAAILTTRGETFIADALP